MSSGKRLKRIRELRNLTQKELGIKINISDNEKVCENRIALMETDKRPVKNRIDDIAEVLKINPKAITLPDENTYEMLMLTLFEYERFYNIHPTFDQVNNKINITLDSKNNPNIFQLFKSWSDKYEQLISGEISKEEYEEWKYQYTTTKVLKNSDK